MLNPVRKVYLEIKCARHVPTNVTRLKEFSYVAWFVERMFFWMEFLSPSILFIPTRNLIHRRLHDINRDDEKETYIVERMRNRAKHVDSYIIACIVVQIALAAVLEATSSSLARAFVQIIVTIRIMDIAQANINLNVFDRLRFAESSHVTVSVTRNLILSAITYGELMLSFGLLYDTIPWDLHGATSLHDSFYFSMVTQLTIGYGDIRPLGMARYIASFQGMVGLFFSLLIMGRFVSFIPAVRTVFGDDSPSPAPQENAEEST